MDVQVVSPRILAAVRRTVTIGGVGAVWRPALDQVWAFLRTHPDLRTDGHNIFLYHHPARRGDPMDVDFGVEVVREFAPSGEVKPVETPAGEVVARIILALEANIDPLLRTLSGSFGIATSSFGEEPQELLRIADEAMYQAKRSGTGIEVAA